MATQTTASLPELRSRLKDVEAIRDVYDRLWQEVCSGESRLKGMDPTMEPAASALDLLASTREFVMEKMEALLDDEHSVHSQLVKAMRGG